MDLLELTLIISPIKVLPPPDGPCTISIAEGHGLLSSSSISKHVAPPMCSLIKTGAVDYGDAST